MIERRKAPRRDWVIKTDETGRAVLEWKIDEDRARRQDADPSDRTYDLLKRLDVPELTLEDENVDSREVGMNPYDHDVVSKAKRKPSH